MKVFLVIVSLLFVGPALAQTAWTPRFDFPQARMGHRLAYDSHRQRLVLFGGKDSVGRALAGTWEWDGLSWVRPALGVEPPPRADHGFAYDAARRRTVLFGGEDAAGVRADVWEWDGVAWVQSASAAGPAARRDMGFVYDVARGCCLLFGGATASGFAGDTWEWRASGWTQRTTALQPSARALHGMTYDSARARVVLYGGEPSGLPTYGLNDLWEWDGNAWIARGSSPASARYAPIFCYDPVRNRTLMCAGIGGFVYTTSLTDAWEWDGTTWTPAASLAVTRDGTGVAFVPGRNRILVHGGREIEIGHTSGYLGAPRSDALEHGTAGWSTLRYGSGPSARKDHAMVYDAARRRVLLFGGLGLDHQRRVFDDVWEWDGVRWLDRTAGLTARPSARYGAAIAYDSSRQKALLHGGTGLSTVSDETWEWDGNAWLLRTPATTPGPRYWHAMAYDEARDRMVASGGYDRTFPATQFTWEWDGSSWRHVPHARNVLGRVGPAMAYDETVRRVVLFGGYNGATNDAEFFEWSGSDWTPRSGMATAPLRYHHGMTFDSARGRLVAYGGYVSSARTQQVPIELIGARWVERATASKPDVAGGCPLVYDAARRVCVLFVHGETWEYAPIDPAASTRVGAGCAGSVGTPDLASLRHSHPWLAEPFAGQLTNLVAGTPAALMLGASDSRWGSLALPLALGSVGMPGCTLYSSVELLMPIPNASGTGRWAVPIPASPTLVGRSLHMQGIGAEAAANAFGATLSNALRCQIGAK